MSNVLKSDEIHKNYKAEHADFSINNLQALEYAVKSTLQGIKDAQELEELPPTDDIGVDFTMLLPGGIEVPLNVAVVQGSGRKSRETGELIGYLVRFGLEPDSEQFMLALLKMKMQALILGDA